VHSLVSALVSELWVSVAGLWDLASELWVSVFEMQPLGLVGDLEHLEFGLVEHAVEPAEHGERGARPAPSFPSHPGG